MMAAPAALSVQVLAAGYIAQVTGLAGSLDMLALERVVAVLRDARDSGASVFIIGNGGSAATASHFATDLTNMPRRAGQRSVRAFSLADNSACLTALGNDEGYERVFGGTLESLLRPGDVLVAISASGSSPNIVSAVQLANVRGCRTVALVGFDGGRLKDIAEESLLVSSEIGAYGPVEDLHLIVAHILSGCLSQ